MHNWIWPHAGCWKLTKKFSDSFVGIRGNCDDDHCCLPTCFVDGGWQGRQHETTMQLPILQVTSPESRRKPTRRGGRRARYQGVKQKWSSFWCTKSWEMNQDEPWLIHDKLISQWMTDWWDLNKHDGIGALHFSPLVAFWLLPRKAPQVGSFG